MLNRSRKMRMITWLLIGVLHLALLPYGESFEALAETTDDYISDRVIVSLGDSYSSGEGVEPFFDQEKPLEERVNSQDWCAHRSRYAWSGLLMLDETGLMCQNWDTHWFFVAASGAVTWNYSHEQNKHYYKTKNDNAYDVITGDVISGDTLLDPQKKVWEKLGEKKADYVTLTFGGNDLGFTEVIGTVAICGCYDFYQVLCIKLALAREKIAPGGEVRKALGQLYLDVEDDANTKGEERGDWARIIVAGYPTLLDESGKGLLVKDYEARLVNDAVRDFNDILKEIVSECNNILKDERIYYVSVAEKFAGHEAYSDDPYINKMMIGARKQDISEELDPIPEKSEDSDDKKGPQVGLVVSSYSIHPNVKGVLAYAGSVQKKINELEKERSSKSGGKVRIKGSTGSKNDSTESGVKESDIPINMDTYRTILDVLPHLPKYNATDYDTKELIHPGIEKRTGKGYWDDWILGAIFPALWWNAESICKQDSGGYYTYNMEDVIDITTVFANEVIPDEYFRQCAIIVSDDEEGQQTRIENGQLICAKKTGNEPYIEVESVKESGDGFSIFYRYSDGSGPAKDRWEAHFSLLDGAPCFEYTKYLGDNENGNTSEEYEDWGKAYYRAYADLMYEYLIDEDLQPWSPQKSDPMFRGYAVRDINQDGIDELILVAGDEWNGYELLRMYTADDHNVYPVIIDDHGKSIKYAFSGNKIRLWDTMWGSGISGEAAFTFEPGRTGLTLVEAISCYAEKPPYVDNPLCYSVTNEDGKYNSISESGNEAYFCFTDTPDESFTGKVIPYSEYKKGISGYDFTTLDFEPELLNEEAAQKVAKMAEE